MYLEVVTGIVEDGGGWRGEAGEWRVYIAHILQECN